MSSVLRCPERAHKFQAIGKPLLDRMPGMPEDAYCDCISFGFYFQQDQTTNAVRTYLPFEKIVGNNVDISITVEGRRGVLMFRVPRALLLIGVAYEEDLKLWERILEKLSHIPGGFQLRPDAVGHLSRFGARAISSEWKFTLNSKIDFAELCLNMAPRYDPRKHEELALKLIRGGILKISPDCSCIWSSPMPIHVEILNFGLTVVYEFPLEEGVSDSRDAAIERWLKLKQGGS